MANSLYIENTLDPVDALWTLFQTQSQVVKEAFKKRLMSWNPIPETYNGDIEAYESTLSEETQKEAHKIAQSIVDGVAEVEKAVSEGKRPGRSARELLKEIREGK